jgi:type I restriction enzyme S subunit
MSWRTVKLGEFLKVSRDRFKPDDEAIQGLKRVDKIDFSGAIYLSHKPSNTDMILVKHGDLLISGINVEKGAVAVYDGHEDITATIHYSSYEFDEEQIDIEFLKLFLKSPEFLDAIKKQVPGGIKTEMKPKHLLPLEVTLPDLDEQKEVVEKFSSFNSKQDSILSELSHQLALVKELRQAYLREAMQGKLNCQDATDEPGEILLEKIKAEKAILVAQKQIKKTKPLQSIEPEQIPFEIPSSWTWCRLGEITTLITDGKHGDCKNQENSGYYFLSAKDVQNGELLYDNARQITYKDFEETHRRTNLEPGDLCLVNTGATIGKTAVPRENELTRKTTFQKSVAVVKLVKQFSNIKFLDYLIKLVTPSLLKTSRGSAINNLLLGDLRNLVTPLPPLAEQERFVAKLDKLMKFCDELEVNIRRGIANADQLLQTALKEALEPK